MRIPAAAAILLASSATLSAAPVADSRARPKPGVLKTFGDWAVGCDNAATCTMASLSPEAGDFQTFTLRLTRQPGPAGGLTIAIDAAQDDKVIARAAVIGTQRFALSPIRDTAALATAMAGGAAIDVRDAGGLAIGRLSLTGAAAALRYIDAVQGRAGGVTAIVARGARPAGTVPAAPVPPVIVAPPTRGTAARPTSAQIRVMRKAGQCDIAMLPADMAGPETAALGDGRTLVLLPCSTGAYNLSSAVFVLDQGKIAPARFDAPSGFAEAGAGVRSVVNGGWDAGTLSSYAKGRGIGDCGTAQRFVWDGRAFRLSEEARMEECRGNPDFIPVWRATVVRR